jgi:tetratricopeptide (TPR) repeat protein
LELAGQSVGTRFKDLPEAEQQVRHALALALALEREAALLSASSTTNRSQDLSHTKLYPPKLSLPSLALPSPTPPTPIPPSPSNQVDSIRAALQEGSIRRGFKAATVTEVENRKPATPRDFPTVTVLAGMALLIGLAYILRARREAFFSGAPAHAAENWETATMVMARYDPATRAPAQPGVDSLYFESVWDDASAPEFFSCPEDQSVSLHDESLHLTKQQLGPDHPHTLISMNNLAEAFRGAGKLDKALSLHEATLQLRKSKLGAEHPHTLRSMNNLALAYRAAGKLDQALPLLEEAVRLRKAKLGPAHPDTLASMTNLAALREAKGDAAGARALREEAARWSSSRRP